MPSSYRDFRPSLRFARMLAVSPDGNRLAYIDDHHGQFNVAVQSTDGAPVQRLTSYVDHTVRWVAWHPTGDSLIFFADAKGDECTQVYWLDLDSAEPRALTTSPGVEYAPALGDPFSPDGRLLAYAGNDREPRDQDVLVRNLDTGQVKRVYAEGGQVHAGHWSPDGAWLTAAEWIDESSHHVVYVLSADGSSATQLTPRDVPGTYWLGPWLPDGSGFLVRTNVAREFAGLAVMDPTTGTLRWMATPDWDVADVALSADGRTLVWLVNEDGASRLYARDLRTGEDIPAPAFPAGVAEAPAVASDGRFVAMTLSSPVSPLNIVVVDLPDGKLRRLTEAAPAVDPDSLVEPELIHYLSQDGTRIPAYLYRPPDATEPMAAVISIHGGPQSAERPAYVGLYQQLVSEGIAVLAPNARGSTGYGKAYQTRLHHDWGGVDLADWEYAARYLRSRPWVDPARLGLIGGSYGGFGVLSCLSRLPEYGWAAAVVYFGISNLVTLAKAAPPTWRAEVATQIGDPDTEAEFLLARSPITYADQINAPLFVIQGANDRRVPRHESDQIVERLRSGGLDVRYDVYPDEGHGFSKTENQVRAHSDAVHFLVSHLAT